MPKDTREKVLFWSTACDIGWNKGIRQGRKEGLEKGQHAALIVAIERIWLRRFGSAMPPGRREAIARLTSAQLDRLTDALFDLDSPSAAAGWIEQECAAVTVR